MENQESSHMNRQQVLNKLFKTRTQYLDEMTIIFRETLSSITTKENYSIKRRKQSNFSFSSRNPFLQISRDFATFLHVFFFSLAPNGVASRGKELDRVLKIRCADQES